MADITAEALACTCAHLADEIKAEDILVLEVGDIAHFTDYFVIVTGRNSRQVNSIAEAVARQTKHLGRLPIGREGDAASGWILIDLGDCIVHVFSPEARTVYDLELLWGDAPHTDWAAATPLVSSLPDQA
jgi:ribosome-associated protein